jgi:hypothetical protein
MMVRAQCDRGRIGRLTFQFVRHDAQNRTILRSLADEAAAFDQISGESKALGAELAADGDGAVVKLSA